MRGSLLCLCASGCFVGLPPAGEEPWFDDRAQLDAPDCASASIEPDDGTTDSRFSALGLLTDEPRTLCGRIARASNDGQTYTGDIDYLLYQILEEGRVHLSLDWDEETDLDLLATQLDDEWIASDGDTLELRLEPGFYTVLVAGLDGPPADYVLTAWLE